MIKIEDKRKNTKPEEEFDKETENLEEDTEVISDEEIPAEKPEENKKDASAEKPEKPSAEYEALNDKYLRLCAEYDNFRKRSQREKDAMYTDIKARVVNDFLPVFDDLERALQAKTEDEAYRKGVQMIMTQFGKTLEKLGVTEIPAQGQPFNPNIHNAVMHVEDENAGENEIVDVFQKGFQTGDKVIRPSTVKVAN